MSIKLDFDQESEFADICKALPLVVDATYIPNRTDGVCEFTPMHMHYSCILKTEDGKHIIWAGQFSKGWHGAVEYVRKRKASLRLNTSTRDFLTRDGLYRQTAKLKRDSVVVQEIHRHGANANAPTVADVLGCLIMDAQGSDQDFPDWASDLGYSDDSIKTKAIWEACNAHRRALEKAFHPETLAALYACEI